ncbi:putative transcriptional regulator [Bacillus sp. TS-2]|nr:putative transcriptional regulator [Bacillus sp. TS-2]
MKNIVQSVERALQLIEIVAKNHNGLSIKEISDHLDLPKSTVHRLLATLLQKKYIRQDARTKDYFAGYQILSLAGELSRSMDVRQVARPFIEKLSAVTNEVIHLCIRDHHEVVYIDKVESNQTITMHSRIGMRSMLHCTGVGKILLTTVDDLTITNLLQKAGMPSFTTNTIVTIPDFLQEMKKVRENHYALDDIEHEEGIRCIASGIYNHHGEVIAAISISGPDTRITEERIEQTLKSDIIRAAKEISNQFGYYI